MGSSDTGRNWNQIHTQEHTRKHKNWYMYIILCSCIHSISLTLQMFHPASNTNDVQVCSKVHVHVDVKYTIGQRIQEGIQYYYSERLLAANSCTISGLSFIALSLSLPLPLPPSPSVSILPGPMHSLSQLSHYLKNCSLSPSLSLSLCVSVSPGPMHSLSQLSH